MRSRNYAAKVNVSRISIYGALFRDKRHTSVPIVLLGRIGQIVVWRHTLA